MYYQPNEVVSNVYGQKKVISAHRLVKFFLISLITLIVTGFSTLHAENSTVFPDRVFAPYVDVLNWPTFSIENMYNQTGQKYYTLAFIVSGSDCQPSWGGVIAMEDDWYKDQIQFIRSVGGDVIISFGGANGTELALSCTNVEDLQAAYQSVIDRYNLTWVDFDIEGMALGHRASVDLRNKAIHGLQTANSDLKIAFCIPVLPQGLTADGLYILKNARDNGVRIDLVNVMAMDYGDVPAPAPEGQMGHYAITAAENTRTQALALGIDTQIGITPMIGQNDVISERFYIQDAIEVLNWANDPARQSWVSLLSFWSSNRDNGNCPEGPAQAKCSGIFQEDFEFAKIFLSFSEEGTGNYLPSISIENPADQTIFDEGDNITITANAYDQDGTISKVTFFLNGNEIAVDTVAPYTFNLINMETGIYELIAEATDNTNGTKKSIPVQIFVGYVCTAPQWLSSTIYTANDEVSYNGHKWEAKWWTKDAEPGTTGQWGVWNDLGVCESSSSNIPPEITITSPTSNATFNEGDNLTITANSIDQDGSVKQVEFFDGNISLGIDNLAPYNLIVTDLHKGIHSLTAISTDNEGASSTASVIEIIVGNVCVIPKWSASTIYVGDDEVSHNGHRWKAKWWTRNNEPGTTGKWGVWLDMDICQ